MFSGGMLAGSLLVVIVGAAVGVLIGFHPIDGWAQWVGAAGSVIGGLGAAAAALISLHATNAAIAERLKGEQRRFSIDQESMRERTIELLHLVRRKGEFANSLIHSADGPYNYTTLSLKRSEFRKIASSILVAYFDLERNCRDLLTDVLQAASLENLVDLEKLLTDIKSNIRSLDDGLQMHISAAITDGVLHNDTAVPERRF